MFLFVRLFVLSRERFTARVKQGGQAGQVQKTQTPNLLICADGRRFSELGTGRRGQDHGCLLRSDAPEVPLRH